MAQKICYYELLDVPRDCDAKELKKAYRVQSLKYHPDKCKDENAKEKMIAINEAYEVLSDPNERTWYDNHRNQILSGKDEKSEEDTLEASFGGISIKKYQNHNCYSGFKDDKGGFYQVFRSLFEQIKSQELKAYQQNNFSEEFCEMLGFGDSQTSPHLVYQFYVKWDNFTTYKNFSWADQYRVDEENRFTKRLIERENNKFRVKEKKNYIDTIKKIIQMIQKKDPRYAKYEQIIEYEQEQRRKQKELQQQQKEKQIKEMRQQSRLEEQQRFKEEEELIKQGLKEDPNQFNHIQDPEDLPDFYCQVCEKEFKSQGSLDSHNNSKQHKKNLKELMQQVGTQDEIEEVEQIQQQSKKKKNKKNKQFQQLNQESQDSKIQVKEQEIEIKEDVVEKVQQKKGKNNKKNKVQETIQVKNQELQINDEDEDDDDDIDMTQLLTNKKPNQQVKVEISDENDDDDEIDMTQLLNNKKAQQKTKLEESEDDDDEVDMTQLLTNKKAQQKDKQEEPKNEDEDDDEIDTKQLGGNKKQQKKKNQDDQRNEKKQNESKKEEIKIESKQNKKGDSKVQLAQQGEIDVSELSKAKQKKLKKLKQEQAEADSKFKCKTCKQGFPSKTKLFKHFDENKDHAKAY